MSRICITAENIGIQGIFYLVKEGLDGGHGGNPDASRVADKHAVDPSVLALQHLDEIPHIVRNWKQKKN
jgi:hypothetical protein